MSRKLENIRNIGIIAHIDAGKTTVTEQMLFRSGSKHRVGKVDSGTTTTDDDVEEQERGITIFSACVTFQWNDSFINLLDTPGHVDFTAEVERCLRVLDGAVVVFSAREGVEAQSETVWRQADRYGVPRIAFINKLDREGADFSSVVAEMRTRLGAHPICIQMPVGMGPSHVDSPFRAIVDLVTMKLLTFPGDSADSKMVVADLPDELRDDAELARSEMLEELYNYSNEMMELALSEVEIPEQLIHSVLRSATIDRQIQPVLCGSALHGIGVQPVLNAAERYLPSPLDRPPVEGADPKKPGETVKRKPSPKEPFAGLVFKILPAKTGDLYWVRVYSGEVKANTRVYCPGKDKKENIAQLWQIHASKKERDGQIESVSTGDIVCIIGPRYAVTGDTLCDSRDQIELENIEFPESVIEMAIEPESTAERKKLAETLEMLKRQDPTFRAVENEETGQTLISGMGELHLEVIKNRLLRDFNLNVKVHKPRVSYRETIESKVEVTGECHRQVAGLQLFAKLRISVEPIAIAQAKKSTSVKSPDTKSPDTKSPDTKSPDANSPGPSLGALENVDDSVQVLNRSFGDDPSATLIESAMLELTSRTQGGGPIGSFPLTKMKVTILGGEVAEEGSTEMAFSIAAGEAFEKALQAAGPVLLEPIMKLSIATPDEYYGDFIGDLSQRRAQIVSTDNRQGMAFIEAHAPLAELFGYSNALRSLSQGRASSSMEPLGYEPAPPEVKNSFGM